MLGGCSTSHQGEDPLPPANTWALWAPLSDAGEALYHLAASALSPVHAQDTSGQTHNATPATLPPLPSLAPPNKPNPEREKAQSQTEGTHPPPARPPSPSPRIAALASTHPYSSAFLMGAALSGSILVGAAAARVAMARMSATAARSGASGSGTVGSGGGNRAFASALAGRNDPMTHGKGKTPGGVDSAPKGENDARLARLETLVREMHIQQKGFLATIVANQPSITGRLAGIEDALAKTGAGSAGSSKIDAMDARLARSETLLREMHIRQKGFLDTIVAAQPDISARLGKIEKTLADGAKERTSATVSRAEATAAMNRVAMRVAGLEDLMNASTQKSRRAMAQSHALTKELKDEILAMGHSFELLDAEVGQISRYVESRTKEHNPETVTSINDLANEGIVQDAKAEEVKPKAKIAEWPKTASESVGDKQSQADGAPKTAATTAIKADAKNTDANETNAKKTDAKKTDAKETDAKETDAADTFAYLTHMLKSDQPIPNLGINDSGEWQLDLWGGRTLVDARLHLYQQPIMLNWISGTRTRRTRGRDTKQTDRLYSSTVGPFSAAVVFEGDVDMVLLDDCWWRCSREGGVYTIREQITSPPECREDKA